MAGGEGVPLAVSGEMPACDKWRERVGAGAAGDGGSGKVPNNRVRTL